MDNHCLLLNLCRRNSRLRSLNYNLHDPPKPRAKPAKPRIIIERVPTQLTKPTSRLFQAQVRGAVREAAKSQCSKDSVWVAAWGHALEHCERAQRVSRGHRNLKLAHARWWIESPVEGLRRHVLTVQRCNPQWHKQWSGWQGNADLNRGRTAPRLVLLHRTVAIKGRDIRTAG